jgi:hypothetical protein
LSLTLHCLTNTLTPLYISFRVCVCFSIQCSPEWPFSDGQQCQDFVFPLRRIVLR